MSRRSRCFEIDVDGIPVRIQGDPNMSAESRAALEELIRVATRHAATLPPSRTDAIVRRIRRRAGL